jgi:DNA polymerase-3 subunit alpha
VSLFSSEALPQPEPDAGLAPWSDSERLACEKEVLGLYLTGNPLSEYRDVLASQVSHTTAAVREGAEGRVAIAGIIGRLRRVKIKGGRNAGRMMGRMVLEDMEGSIPVTLFADQLQKFDRLLEEGSIVLVRGVVRERGSDWELAAEEVVSLEEIARRPVQSLDLRIDRPLSETAMLDLRDTLIERHGETPVRFEIERDGQLITILPEERFRVEVDEELVAAVESIVGQGRVRTRFGPHPA